MHDSRAEAAARLRSMVADFKSHLRTGDPELDAKLEETDRQAAADILLAVEALEATLPAAHSTPGCTNPFHPS